jgi:hypothetical protein
MAKDTYTHGKRDLHTRQKRPTRVTKETCYHERLTNGQVYLRNLRAPQLETLHFSQITKETCLDDKRDLHTRQKRPALRHTDPTHKVSQKRPTHKAKEAYTQGKRDLRCGKQTLHIRYHKRDLRRWQTKPTHKVSPKRPAHMAKEAYTQGKRDLCDVLTPHVQALHQRAIHQPLPDILKS